MKNRKGFTLIEVLAVILIIGVIMMIAVPNVANYIFGSRKSSFATNVHAYIETVRAEYEAREYGPLLDDDEIMFVPIQVVKLEKSDAGSSPFGEYDFDRSYIVIVPERNTYEYYANVKDVKNNGVIMRTYNVLDGDVVVEDATSIPSWKGYNGTESIYRYNNKDYKWCENRTSKANSEDATPILVLCEE